MVYRFHKKKKIHTVWRQTHSNCMPRFLSRQLTLWNMDLLIFRLARKLMIPQKIQVKTTIMYISNFACRLNLHSAKWFIEKEWFVNHIKMLNLKCKLLPLRFLCYFRLTLSSPFIDSAIWVFAKYIRFVLLYSIYIKSDERHSYSLLKIH